MYNYQVPVFLLVSFVLLTAWYETRQSVNNVGLIQVSFFCVSGIIAVRFVSKYSWRNLTYTCLIKLRGFWLTRTSFVYSGIYSSAYRRVYSR